MNRKKLAAYGQEFEDDDEEGSSISKKPTPIHEEIATDERGKRRFHGAFTGGFSAGYWNTVGSKHGWVPQVFSSSRDARGEKFKQRAEDFMDAEDLGEFGIGNRSIKQTSTFGDSSKRKMAWERDETSVSSIAKLFEDVVKPVSNSIGVRMLRSMGWREGRGVGLANTKQKKQRAGEFDREQAEKVAPQHEFANEEALVQQLTPLTGSHGIGYQGLRQSTVLDEKYGQTALALKSGKKSSKGIRGQAFGVGAFEEEDESVYTNFDLTQFDFSLDVSGNEETNLKTQRIDTAFELQPKRLNPRKFYAPPRVPPNFRGDHRPIPMDVSRLPQLMKDDVKQMNAVQRAKFLGEDRVAALEIGGSKEGKKTAERRSRWDIKANEVEAREHERGGEADEERDRRLRNRVEFPEEPQRQARFKEFLHYLRRGLPYPQPTDLTVWEWEWEKKEFESKLTSEERGMLPEVRSRAQPLAKTAISAPIFEAMASKFVKEAQGDLKVGQKDEDKLAAVKMEMFGEKTRMSFEWYPDSLLAKRFNVPHPYPGAEMVGVPALQKNAFRKKDVLAEIGGMTAGIGMPNTANEVEMRDRLLKTKARREAEAKKRDEGDDEEEKKYEDAQDSEDDDEPEDVKKEEKAPKSFFDFVFGGAGSSNEDSEDDDEDSEDERARELERRQLIRRKEEELKRKEAEKEEEERKRFGEARRKAEEADEKGRRSRRGGEEEEEEIQIIEVKSASSYGPAPPPKMSSEKVLAYLKADLAKGKEKKKKEKKKKEKKEKKAKKSKKSKKESKKRSRRRDSSSDDDSSEDEWEEKK